MASDKSFVEFIVDQVRDAGEISSRMMFGEYAVYSGRKVVLLICDNKVFLKPTEAGRAFIGDVVEEPAYQGAKPSFLIEGMVDDREWMTELVRLTAEELPEPKPKKKKTAKKN